MSQIPENTIDERVDERLAREPLFAYLRSNGLDGKFEIRQFPAGSSNLTYLLKTGTDEYVLRRPPFGNTVKTAHDMRREFEVLSKLSAVYAPAPKPLLYCDDDAIVGSEFYLMECRRGLIIRGRIPDVGSPRVNSPHDSKGSSQSTDRPVSPHDLNTSQAARERVCQSFIRNLAELHSLDYTAAGLGELGKPVGYCRRQVEGWTKRYFAAKTDEHPALEAVITWLSENVPAESGASLIHNDYKFDNIILDPEDLTRVTAVLDWEMVTVGDPLMDLGTTLGYWMSADAGKEMLSMPFNPRILMENVSRRELADMYSEASGRDVSNILFYYAFGTFKVAVIAQQIYARFVKGFTKDNRFANFDRFVAALGLIADNAIERECI
ncbi:MAG: phosphotransferase family protein [Pyrinomonadaceae bacterium]